MNKHNLELQIARMEAVMHVQNVMGRYAFYHTAKMHRECMELFALQSPDVRAEMMWGVYEGADSIERLYPGWHAWVDGDAKGSMHMHPLTTPVIEIAADAQTARAAWLCPGLECGGPPGHKLAAWGWNKYGIDFILENGVWKIWHLHVYGIFMTPFSMSWVDVPPMDLPPMDEDAEDFHMPGMDEDAPKPPPTPREFWPDSPPTTNWSYRAERVYPKDQPMMPQPYDTFNQHESY